MPQGQLLQEKCNWLWRDAATTVLKISLLDIASLHNSRYSQNSSVRFSCPFESTRQTQFGQMVQTLREIMDSCLLIHKILWAFCLTPIASLGKLAGVDGQISRLRMGVPLACF